MRVDWVTVWRTNLPGDDFMFHATRELSKTATSGGTMHVFRELAEGLRRTRWSGCSPSSSGRTADMRVEAEFLGLFRRCRGRLRPIFDEERRSVSPRRHGPTPSGAGRGGGRVHSAARCPAGPTTRSV